MRDIIQAGLRLWRHRTGRWIVIAAVGLIVVVVGVAVLLWPTSNPPIKPAYNPFREQAATLEKRTPPKEPIQQALYYGQLGQNYEQLEDWDKALKNYLQAQVILDDHQLADQFAYYFAIAEAYRAMGDTAKAEEYEKKHQEYLAKHPEYPGTVKPVKIWDER